MTETRDLRTRMQDKALRELLQSLFVAELLHPSQDLWLVSPWITDVAILDNAAGQFRSFAPELAVAPLVLSEVLIALAERGTCVHVCTRPDDQNARFISAVELARNRMPDRIKLTLSEELHEKGLLARRFYLHGSFNFTNRGITKGEELASLITASDRISQAHIDFDKWWPS